MRILYLHQFFATRDSAHPTRSYEFARRMVAQGHDVTMVTGSSRLPELHDRGLVRRADVDGIHVRSVRNEYSNRMGYVRRMVSFGVFAITSTIEALRVKRPDVVFATSTPLTIGVPGWIASVWHRVPFVFEVRDLWPLAAFQMGALRAESVVGRLASWFERFVYRHADAVVGLSPGMVDGILAAGGDPATVHMIPNCSDLDLFHPGEKDPATVARYGLEGRFVAGHAGALGPINAPLTMVETAQLLAERGRDDIAILLAGDGRLLPTMREKVAELGLTNVAIAGPVPKHDLPALLRSCDVLLVHVAKVPVLYTASPNKLFDGLATGRPVIVNSPGWTKPLVEEADAGLYVEPEDAVALADALERLADDPAAVARMGANARALAEREFARDDQADRLIGVLQSVSDERKARR